MREDRQPKMFPIFIQLMSYKDYLYALDENGEVWRRQSTDFGIAEWWKLTEPKVDPRTN